MTGEVMASWVNRVWGPNRDDVRRLLILDQARIHTMQATQDLLEEKVLIHFYLPHNVKLFQSRLWK
jgi:hypothetical protein